MVFIKFLSGFLITFGVLLGNLSALSLRNALQMPESFVGQINDLAISVNEMQVLDLMGVGASFEKGDSVICAFPESKAEVIPEDSMADEIMRRFANKEIILADYRKAAQCAGAIAAHLNRRPLVVNQLKLITFCGARSFDRLDGMGLPCRLNFSHRFDEHDYQNSPWILMPPIGMSCCYPSKYLPSKGVQTAFVCAQNKSRGACARLDWRSLGQ